MFTWNTILALKLSYLGPTGPGPVLMLGGCLIVNNIAILKLIHSRGPIKNFIKKCKLCTLKKEYHKVVTSTVSVSSTSKHFQNVYEWEI